MYCGKLPFWFEVISKSIENIIFAAVHSLFAKLWLIAQGTKQNTVYFPSEKLAI